MMITFIVLIVSTVLSISCLGIGAYFAKLYWDFIRASQKSIEKPLLTELTTCNVTNNVENCIMERSITQNSQTYDVRYCHAIVKYSFHDETFTNVTLDTFPKFYKLNTTANWIELKKGDLNGMFDNELVYVNTEKQCYTNSEYPAWFVGFGKRDLFYYYKDISSFLTTSSIVAVATLLPASCLILFVILPLIGCLAWQYKKWRAIPRHLVGEQHFGHVEMSKDDEQSEDEEYDIRTKKKNKDYF